MRTLSRLGRAAAASLYFDQRQYITVARLDGPAPAAADPLGPDPPVVCVVADSLSAFAAVMHEIPDAFRDSAATLATRVAQGCVVCLARRPRDDGAGHEVVGYEIAERGVFSALGRRRPVAPEIVFSHYVEVRPGWRGRGIHGRLFAARDAYFRARGGRVVCGVVAPQNRASLRALERAGHAIVGHVTRISLGCGVLIWDTPWHRIDYALRSTSAGAGAPGWAPAPATAVPTSGATPVRRAGFLPPSPLARSKP
jgi:GNAT superfamily N-acetyltransferase